MTGGIVSLGTRKEADASGYTTSGLGAGTTAGEVEADTFECEAPLGALS
jgi:hypothetical protein